MRNVRKDQLCCFEFWGFTTYGGSVRDDEVVEALETLGIVYEDITIWNGTVCSLYDVEADRDWSVVHKGLEDLLCTEIEMRVVYETRTVIEYSREPEKMVSKGSDTRGYRIRTRVLKERQR